MTFSKEAKVQRLQMLRIIICLISHPPALVEEKLSADELTFIIEFLGSVIHRSEYETAQITAATIVLYVSI